MRNRSAFVWGMFGTASHPGAPLGVLIFYFISNVLFVCEQFE